MSASECRSIGERTSIGVVLFQLGGPDSLEAIEPFLYNLFSDPDIIDFPLARLAREPLARLISSRRSRKVARHYAAIGGRSPIGELTERQAAALELELSKRIGAHVLVAMRYWHPKTEQVVDRLRGLRLDGLVLLPLYPQYSKTTTGSSLNEWRRHYTQNGVPVRLIREFYDHPLYIEAVVERVNQTLAKFNAEVRDCSATATTGAGRLPPDVHLVFTAHGIPVSVIEGGDPYQSQVETTVKLVVKRGGWPNPFRLCYQSRSGPGRWLRPFLDETLDDLAAARAKKVLAIPISFVSDHLETLHEIDIEAREYANRLGIQEFAMMPALNDSPLFIQALRELVLEQAEGMEALGGNRSIEGNSSRMRAHQT